MSSLRWRYAWRSLWMHKTRSLLVILSMAVGIFAFAMIAGTASTIRSQLPLAYLALDPASATLHTSLFDDETVEAVKRMDSIADADGRRSVIVQYLNPKGEWHDLQLFAIDDYSRNRINRVVPYAGAWPPPDRAILIERNSLRLVGAEVGENLTLEVGENAPRRLPIAGLAHDMNEPPAQITGIPYGYVSRETLEWLGLTREFNQLRILVAEGRFDKEPITDTAHEVADKLERSGLTVYWTEVPDPGKHFVEDFLPTILLVLGSLSVLALLLSGFLVINVVTAIVTQQTRQIGVMKTIGARHGQITALYLRMVVVFGAAGLLLALPLGVVGSFGFSRFIAGQLNFDLDRPHLSPAVLALELVAGLLVPLLAALPPILSASRMTVHEAIGDAGLELGRGRRRTGAVLSRLSARLSLSQPARISLRNTFRRRGRLVRTLIPLLLGGAMFMTVLSLRASMFRTLDATLASGGFDVQIGLGRPVHTTRIEALVRDTPGVAALELWTVLDGVPVRSDGSEGDSVIVHALPAQTELFKPEMVGGRWLQPEDGNAIVVPAPLLEDEPELCLGCEITLRIRGEESVWRIVGVNKRFQPVIAPPIVYINQPGLWRELGNLNEIDNVRVLTAEHDAATHTAVANELEQRLKRAGFEIRSKRTATEDRLIFTERFNIMTTILTVMSFLMAAVGSLGLMGTMSINVLERTREIGVMRAIGASTRSLLRLFIMEGVLIGLLSWAGALLVSPLMSFVLGRRLGLAFTRVPLIYVYDLRGPLLWLVLVVAVSALASLIPARSAAAVSVRETLVYE